MQRHAAAAARAAPWLAGGIVVLIVFAGSSATAPPCCSERPARPATHFASGAHAMLACSPVTPRPAAPRPASWQPSRPRTTMGRFCSACTRSSCRQPSCASCPWPSPRNFAAAVRPRPLPRLVCWAALLPCGCTCRPPAPHVVHALLFVRGCMRHAAELLRPACV